MSHVHLDFFLIGWVFHMCLLGLVGFCVIQVHYIFTYFLSVCSIHYWKWDFELSSYLGRTVYFSFESISFCFIFWGLLLGAEMFITVISYLLICNVCLISCKLFSCKVNFVWYLHRHSSCLLVTICMQYPFPSLLLWTYLCLWI